MPDIPVVRAPWLGQGVSQVGNVQAHEAHNKKREAHRKENKRTTQTGEEGREYMK
jgi:hypothetical protein